MASPIAFLRNFIENNKIVLKNGKNLINNVFRESLLRNEHIWSARDELMPWKVYQEKLKTINAIMIWCRLSSTIGTHILHIALHNIFMERVWAQKKLLKKKLNNIAVQKYDHQIVCFYLSSQHDYSIFNFFTLRFQNNNNKNKNKNKTRKKNENKNNSLTIIFIYDAWSCYLLTFISSWKCM